MDKSLIEVSDLPSRYHSEEQTIQVPLERGSLDRVLFALCGDLSLCMHCVMSITKERLHWVFFALFLAVYHVSFIMAG